MSEPLHLLELMITIREFEELARRLYRGKVVQGALHLYVGEEATAVGACAALRQDDCILSTHRGHGHCIAKGGDLKKMLAELCGRKTGYCRGRGGSMHLFAPDIGLMGGNGIVGGGIPLALGAAYTAKYQESDRVVLCFFSDGASNQGTCHESMNMAALWKLPLIFLCENNQYAATTPVADTLCVPDVAQRAAGYGMPGEVVDGMDVLAVHEATSRAVARARAGEGPSLIECKTFRYDPHCMVLADHRKRPKGETERWKGKDPIDSLEKKLLDEKQVTPESLGELRQRVMDKLSDAEAFARESDFPDPDDFRAEHVRGNWQCVR